jgi:hypothetical protein
MMQPVLSPSISPVVSNTYPNFIFTPRIPQSTNGILNLTPFFYMKDDGGCLPTIHISLLIAYRLAVLQNAPLDLAFLQPSTNTSRLAFL